jgi:hypothetical protein
MAWHVYEFLPALAKLAGAQTPILAVIAPVAVVFFVFTIPLSYWLANVFSRAGYARMDRQTNQLKQFRERRKNSKRDGDSFTIG